ncbi:MAG: cytochrome c maturation protein CcmE [Bacteroidetes bacterium]|nr:MAG: cytochrome c maturation protein CcmE [Bacteroidota bacterium]REK08058.1 MAG: cytochrome c maturation protein CcmE [Bacteroidota bacterium]REK32263.1 MAG: cytochrome c maturation protein CcmE [Bacteroidota bacterium]REK47415.1 MAG: cytochrome c maturation protein CcmE [Bacteroidota bacterium]
MKNKHIIAIVVIAISIAAILSTVADSSTYASFATALKSPNKTFHVVGLLVRERPQEYNPEVDADLFTFYMKDMEGIEKKVLLHMARPQDFEKSEQIVVIGKMEGDEFVAHDILMKCPSKYNDPKSEIESMSRN